MFNIKRGKKILESLSNILLGDKEWEIPDVSLLSDPPEDELKKEINYTPPVEPENIIKVLKLYGIDGSFVDYNIGSSVTTYEISVPAGTKLNTITNRREDIARDLGATSLRIVQSVNKTSTIGFEIENKERYGVYFKSMFNHMPDLKLPVILGEDTFGNKIYEDLTKMPHLLVAGRTGSGKSVFLNTIITTLICKYTPADLRLLMVDPKQVEFAAYEELPHLFDEDGEPVPIAHEADEARHVLDIAVREMEHRFELMKEIRAKKIDDYNERSKDKLPYIVFIVDEFSDLLQGGLRNDRLEVEKSINRIAQKARAVGIHMILATQRPSTDVVTGLIKSNIPARIAFSVSSYIDSRVILDESGAEALAGQGDMLYKDPNARNEYSRIKRIQAPWISDGDIDTIIEQG